MPNTLSALPSSVYKVTNDPTQTIAGDVPSDISQNPYAEMTDELLFGAINLLLQDIDDATGLDLLGMVSPLEALLGADGGLLSGLVGFLDPSSSTVGGGVLGPLLDLIPGLGSGTGTLGGLGSFLNPTTLTSALGGVLAPLLSGTSILGSLIPGLDASKIISGSFGASLLQPVIDAVSSGFGGASGLGFAGLASFLGGLSFGGISFDDLIALIPGIGGGLSGSTGLGSILSDITGILGSPTALGTGTPSLPSVSSIPILGGLLSGGSILGSLIPSLDGSKIGSGTIASTFLPSTAWFTSIASSLLSGVIGAGLIPSLDGSKIGSGTVASTFLPSTAWFTSIAASLISGVLGTGNIPSLPASQIGSGTFLASLIPSLDGSKIGSGTIASGFLPSTAWFTSIASSLLSGTIGAGLIPSLDGSKIGSGTIASTFLPSTAWFTSIAASLISGVLGTGNIPSLPASQIGSGTFLASLIPSLDGSKIGSGTIASGFLPSTAWFTSIASSLLSGVIGAGLIPSIDASKIGSGTIASTFLPSTAWFTSIASSLLSGTIASGLIPSIDASKIGSGTIASTFLPSTAWFASIPASSLTGTITETVTGLGTLRDSFLNGLLNASGSGYTNAQAQQQAATVAQQAASAQAAAAAANATLAAQAGQSNSNNAGGGIFKNISPVGADGATLSATDFASTGPTSGDLQIRGGNGYIGIRSSNATNTVGYYGILNYLFTTDNQSIEVALGDQGSYDSAYTTLYMHCDTSHTVGAYCSIGSGRIVIGSYTRSGGTYAYTPFSGGTYTGTIQSGMRAGFRNVGTTWSITVNGNSVLNVTNATVTFSAARRSAAISMDRQHSSGFFGWGAADYDSFRVAFISMSDFVVPTFIGSGAKVFRASATAVSPVTAASSQILPASFFDNTEASTSDITVDLATGKFTVANAGWYKVAMRIQFNLNMCGTATGGFFDATPLLYKNGSISQWGTPSFGENTNDFVNGAGNLSMGSSFIIYLAATDFVQVGYNHNVTSVARHKFIGAAGGAVTYFDIALLNRSTL